MQSTLPSAAPMPSSAETAAQLTAQGIAAIRAGDNAQAHALLTQALQIERRSEQAWLWLSGVVASDGERRYCLEQVLVINPQHIGAQRGLTMLPATATASSPLPAAPASGIFAGTAMEKQRPAPALTEARPALTPVTLTPAALPTAAPPEPAQIVLPALWFTAAAHAPDAVLSSTAPPPQLNVAAAGAALGAAASEGLAAGEYPPAAIAFVVKSFGQHHDRDQIARLLCDEQGYSWEEANALVAHVERAHSRRVAARQLPLYLFLGMVTLISGLFAIGRSALNIYVHVQTSTLFDPRLLAVLGVGVMMTLGALIGMGQSVRNLWKQ